MVKECCKLVEAKHRTGNMPQKKKAEKCILEKM